MNQSEKWNVTKVGFEWFWSFSNGFLNHLVCKYNIHGLGSDSLEIVESEDDWYDSVNMMTSTGHFGCRLDP